MHIDKITTNHSHITIFSINKRVIFMYLIDFITCQITQTIKS